MLDWVKRAEIYRGIRPGPSTDESERVKAMEREIKELRRANEILKTASAFFAQAVLDRELKKEINTLISIGICMGLSQSAKSCRLPRLLTASMQHAARCTLEYAKRIVGWRVSSQMTTDLIMDVLEQALHDRQPDKSTGLIHPATGDHNMFRSSTPNG